MAYIIIVCGVVFGLSLLFLIKNREVLEEKGFNVRQLLINGILGVIIAIILLIMLSSR